MHFNKIAITAGAAGAYAASTPSICDKYTTALLTNNTAANQYALVTLLVKTAAIGNYTGPGTMNPTLPGSKVAVPGILAPATYMGEQVNLLPYFNGDFLSTNVNNMPTSVNWLDTNTTLLVSDPTSVGEPGTNGNTLISHLISYFGVLLGCTMYGKDGFPAYAGSNNQYNVHKYMDLSEAEFSYFISQVGLSAQSFGASMADITTAATALNTTFGYRCAAPAMVVPGTEPEPQVMCQGASCPKASGATCPGNAAYMAYTASAPASTSVAGSTVLAASSMAMTGTAASATGTGAAASSAAASGSAAASSVAPATGNNAAQMGVSGGLFAGLAAVFGLLL